MISAEFVINSWLTKFLTFKHNNMDYKHVGLPKWASESQSLSMGPSVPAMYANMEKHPTEKMGTNALID